MNYKTLVIKNFSGSFNDSGIGHEVINILDYDDNNSEEYLFFVPPYGTIFKNKEDFLDSKEYKDNTIEKIMIFESTFISNILKLKAIALDPIKITKNQYEEYIKNKVKYNGKKLMDIKFGDNPNNDFISYFTFLIKKDKYYNFENKNIYICHKSSRNEKENNDSLKLAKKIFGEENVINVDDLIIGEKNYVLKQSSKLENWIDTIIKRSEKPKFVLKKYSDLIKEYGSSLHYNKNNILENLKGTKNENLYTNFIEFELNNSETLKNNFIKFLIKKFFNEEKDSNSCIVKTQVESIVEDKKQLNKYFNAKNKKKAEAKLKKYNEHLLNDAKKMKERYDSGFIDILVENDEYSFAIENKIQSGINGKRKREENVITQLDIYKNYLNDKNVTKSKKIKVLLLVPEKYKHKFEKDVAEIDAAIITYKDLYDFFKDNSNYISEYGDDFLQALLKHSFTREGEAIDRLLNELK